MLCFAAKWLGDSKGFFYSEWGNGKEGMLKGLHGLLMDADAVIHYNGEQFDMPISHRELLMVGLAPPSPYKNIDLLRTVRKKFNFLSNKLDYVCQQLDIGGKLQHTGMQLWLDILKGCPEARTLMEAYNVQDVALTEKLYLKLLPWIEQHPNRGLYLEDENTAPTCRNCGSEKVIKEGFVYTALGKYQQYSCKCCGRWGRGRKMLSGVEVR